MHKNKTILKKFYKHIIIFLIISILGFYLIDLLMLKQKERYLSIQTELINTKYTTNYKYFQIMSKDIYSMYQGNKTIISVMDKANNATKQERELLRKKLFLKLHKRYKRLKNMGISQVHFHLKNNVSFLRMHNPSRYGDDLSKIRESVKLTNKTKTPHEGLEIGTIQHGFRFVYPLFKGKIHIGSMEVSFSSQKLIDSIVNSFTIDSHFLILKKYVIKNLSKQQILNLYQDSMESDDYFLEISSHESNYDKNRHKNILSKELLKQIAQKMQKKQAFTIANSYNHNTTIGTYIPIHGINAEDALAYLAVYTESDYLDNLDMEQKYITILFITVILLLFIFSIYATITKNKLQMMAHFDELTTLPNRAYFYIELEQELKRAKRLKQKLAVLFIDLDGFKYVNDTYGHDVGDSLLIDVSRRLERCVRDTDIVARLGGDEFTVVLCDLKNKNDALMIAQKIIDHLSEQFIISKKSIHIGASIGISIYPDDAITSDELIQKSDNSMYIAKNNGKNCAIMYKEN
jgi:diguanylate cyclase (GGDEF)-like protein